MAPSKVEIVRAGIEAYNSGDLEGAVAGFHPDIRWEVAPALAPDASIYEGHAGVLAFWRTWDETFEGFQLELERCDEVSENEVVAITRATGRGAGSGAEVGSPRFVQRFEFAGGRVTRVRLDAAEGS